MKRKNATRNALFTSIISMLLCVSMLVGTTFAWFTDKAESGLNQIIAGNLDVELLYKDGNTYKNAANVKLFDAIELWEPGVVAYETVKIANVGNLALKYALSINTGNENKLNGHGLSEVLRFAVIQGEVTGKTRAEVLEMAEASANKGMLTTYTFGSFNELLASTESEPLTLVVYWPATNDEFDNLFNANNGQTTSDGAALHIDLGLKVLASQETVEEDSFDKYYDDTASYPTNKWLGDVAEKLVIDEATKTIAISSGAELALLAKEVNAGNSYAGYTVKLTDSIDLNNIAWTPIGISGKVLEAKVDGQGKTIYNLKVSGETCVALFGNVKASITGINVINASISGSHYVGTIAGYIYGSVTNCSVLNAKIVAVPNGTVGAYDNGDKVGGIVGYVGEGNYNITGNSAEKVYLKAYRDVGGIAGIAQSNNNVNRNTVTDIEIVVDQATNAYGDKAMNAGGVVGKVVSDKVTNNTETNVKISYIVATVAAAQTALDNAAKGTSITLTAPVNYGTLVIRPVDGNANTTTSLNEANGEGYTVYRNEYLRTVENLTIIGAPGAKVDAFKVESGYIKDSGSSCNLVAVKGLVIDSVEFTDKADCAPHTYSAPVFFNLTWTDVDGLTVKNCKLIGNDDKVNFVYFTIDGSSAFDGVASNITLTGNTVDGIARLCELRQTENVTITDNVIKNTTLHGMLLTVHNGVYTGDVTITGNTADGINNRFVRMAGAGDANVVIKDNVITNYLGADVDYIKVTDSTGTPVIEDNDITYVVNDAAYLTKILENGGNIILGADIDAGEVTFNIPTNTTAVLDLNGYTVSGVDKTEGAYGLFTLNAGSTLTINDSVGSGVITTSATIDSGWSRRSCAISNGRGTVIVNGGKIEHKGGTAMSYAIDNLTNGKNTFAKTVINNGTIKSAYIGIRQFCNGIEADNIVEINGGTIVGAKRSVWMQNPSANANTGTLTIKCGLFNGAVLVDSDDFVVSIADSYEVVETAGGKVLSAK